MTVAGAPAATADVRLERVTKRFGDVVAVDNVSLEIERRAFFALLGPPGAGRRRYVAVFEELALELTT
jgi:spermidine/putrescine transport system ATP-binding protein